MDALNRHRSLYKGTTPPWKETYRKRCVERLKNSRSRLLQRYRQMEDSSQLQSAKGSLLVREVMEEEWSALQAEDGALPSLWGPQGPRQLFGGMKEYDELTVLEEIQRELVSQELSIIGEYERNQQFEEQYISSVVEGMEEDAIHIICPMCHTNHLTINSHFVSCLCGMYINTRRRNMTPEMVQNLLELMFSQHSEGCPHNPVFSLAADTETSTNLMISCQACDFLSIVL